MGFRNGIKFDSFCFNENINFYLRGFMRTSVKYSKGYAPYRENDQKQMNFHLCDIA